NDSCIERVISTNTVQNTDLSRHPKFVQLSIAQTFADAISRITTNRSVSELFYPDENAPTEPLPILEPVVVS
ncbi:MAG: hypothetical protein ACYDA1_00385, partial [Vulcanimicrobiaceae bacterium]